MIERCRFAPRDGFQPMRLISVTILKDFGHECAKFEWYRGRIMNAMSATARFLQRTAFFHLGRLAEYGDTSEISTNPRGKRIKDYITGRYG